MRKEKRSNGQRDFRKCGTLTSAQEAALLAAVQLGNAAREQLRQHTVRIEDIPAAKRDAAAGRQAREALILAYLPFLTMIARRYCDSLSADDLIQESAVGLLKSMDRYRGGVFDFPAVICAQVKYAIQKMLIQRDAVKLPDSILCAIRKVGAVVQCLERGMGRACAEDVAEEMAIPPAIARKLLYYTAAGRRAFSLDAPISGDPSDAAAWIDFLASGSPAPERQAEREDLRERVREVLSTLEPVEESAIRLRFGFVGGEIYSAEETAAELTLPLNEEQKVEIRAMRKLRHPSRNALLREYL